MIKFLFKGLIRDQHRSKLPVMVVSIGVMLVVLLYCYLNGVLGASLDFNSRFDTGHVKVMSKAYAEMKDQIPNDLALVDIQPLLKELHETYPDMEWVERIKFGGLLDVPDENGETKSQGPVMGQALNLYSNGGSDVKRMDIEKAIITGKIPEKPGEVLISDDFANNLEAKVGDQVTLIGSTMNGSMAFYNFTIAGTIRFGSSLLDRGSMFVDISDARKALDMEDAISEILGFFPDRFYEEELAKPLADEFNAKHASNPDEYAPVMQRLSENMGLGQYLMMVDNIGGIVTFAFILIMSIVLWNTGLIGGLRRYGEFGLRIAIGENKGHIYKTMLYESVLIGILGSIFGTIIGLLFAYWLQEVGFDVSNFMKDSATLMPSRFHANITPPAYYLGFIPGLMASVMGTMLAGIGVFKRQTASLFRELEN